MQRFTLMLATIAGLALCAGTTARAEYPQSWGQGDDRAIAGEEIRTAYLPVGYAQPACAPRVVAAPVYRGVSYSAVSCAPACAPAACACAGCPGCPNCTGYLGRGYATGVAPCNTGYISPVRMHAPVQPVHYAPVHYRW